MGISTNWRPNRLYRAVGTVGVQRGSERILPARAARNESVNVQNRQKDSLGDSQLMYYNQALTGLVAPLQTHRPFSRHDSCTGKHAAPGGETPKADDAQTDDPFRVLKI